MGGMRVARVGGHATRSGSPTSIVLASTPYASAEQIAWCAPQLSAIRDRPELPRRRLLRRRRPARSSAWASRGSIAHVTYRSELELAERFGRDPQGDEEPLGGGGRYAVESYLDHHEDKLAGRFDANSYVVLTEAMNSHDVGRGRGGVAAALGRITAPPGRRGRRQRPALPAAAVRRDRRSRPRRPAPLQLHRLAVRARRLPDRDRRGRADWSARPRADPGQLPLSRVGRRWPQGRPGCGEERVQRVRRDLGHRAPRPGPRSPGRSGPAAAGRASTASTYVYDHGPWSITTELPGRDRGRVEPGLLVRLPQGRVLRASRRGLRAPPGNAQVPPWWVQAARCWSSTSGRPLGRLPDQQQPGRAVPPPVPLAAGAVDPRIRAGEVQSVARPGRAGLVGGHGRNLGRPPAALDPVASRPAGPHDEVVAQREEDRCRSSSDTSRPRRAVPPCVGRPRRLSCAGRG